MEWYQFFGWGGNPFVPKANPEVVGVHLTKRSILDYIDNGNICFLNGPAGSGKTSLLKWAEKNVKSHIPVYLSAEELTENANLEKRLQRNAWQKLMRKEFVLLLDESQESNETFQKAMKLNWDKNKIKSIVLSQIEPLKNFPENFQHRVGNRVIRLNKLSKSAVIDMLNQRTGGINPLAAEAMDEIGKKAGYNPRRVLEYAEKVCMEMARREKKTINLFDARKVLEGTETDDGIERPDSIQPPEPPIPELPLPEMKKSGGLSPLERGIVKQLEGGEKTAKDLAEVLSSSEGSIGKQLSKLTHKSIVRITQENRPKRYGLIKK